jgi:hypothetical protein
MLGRHVACLCETVSTMPKPPGAFGSRQRRSAKVPCQGNATSGGASKPRSPLVSAEKTLQRIEPTKPPRCDAGLFEHSLSPVLGARVPAGGQGRCIRRTRLIGAQGGSGPPDVGMSERARSDSVTLGDPSRR